jgi:integrase
MPARTKRPPRAKAPPASWDTSVDQFMDYLRNDQRSPHTLVQYAGYLQAFAAWFKKVSPAVVLTPAEVTDRDLRDWQKHLRQDKLPKGDGRTRKPATVNTELAAIKSFLFWAYRKGVIKTMPDTPRRGKTGERDVKWLDAREQRALLREASRDRDKRNLAIIEILIETGLRVAELVNLKWTDITLRERKAELTVRAGKGAKPRGPLVITPEARQAFKTLRAMDPEVGPDDYVFLGQRGSLTVKGVQALMRRYAQRLNWENLSPHQLRHTFAMNARSGDKPRLDWNELARYLGHSSVKTAMDHYGVPSMRGIGEKMDPDSDDDDLEDID